jgi:hypothetical protein
MALCSFGSGKASSNPREGERIPRGLKPLFLEAVVETLLRSVTHTMKAQ